MEKDPTLQQHPENTSRSNRYTTTDQTTDLKSIKSDTATTMTVVTTRKARGGKVTLTTDGVQGMQKYGK